MSVFSTLAEEFRTALREAAEAARMVRHASANMAHDVRSGVRVAGVDHDVLAKIWRGIQSVWRGIIVCLIFAKKNWLVFLSIALVVMVVVICIVNTTIGLVLVFVAAIVLYQIYKKISEEQAHQLEAKAFRVVLSGHLPVLARKRKYLITQDDYGFSDIKPFEKEIDSLMAKAMPSRLPEAWSRVCASDECRAWYRGLAMRFVTDYEANHPVAEALGDVDVDGLDPIAYEHYCAGVLRNCGWDAKATKASGDQGADVVANYNGTTVVFQCKKYSQPVTNGAVQEAHASMAIYGATIAAVITNHTFTPSARQLAAATKVQLLHHEELPMFAERLGLFQN